MVVGELRLVHGVLGVRHRHGVVLHHWRIVDVRLLRGVVLRLQSEMGGVVRVLMVLVALVALVIQMVLALLLLHLLRI